MFHHFTQRIHLGWWILKCIIIKHCLLGILQVNFNPLHLLKIIDQRIQAGLWKTIWYFFSAEMVNVFDAIETLIVIILSNAKPLCEPITYRWILHLKLQHYLSSNSGAFFKRDFERIIKTVHISSLYAANPLRVIHP